MQAARITLPAVAVVSAVLLLGFYTLIFIGPFFPTEHGRLGHDYEGVFSEMALGAVHFHRGELWVLPWFTPATCGGDLFVAGVANVYFSVFQWLSFYLDLMTAAQLNFLLFALIGYAGTWWLLRRAFELDQWGALLGAALFLFNGFFAYRMVVGHTAFHSFMLIPVIAGLILAHRRPLPLSILLASLLLAYIILASGVYTLVIAVASVTTLLLIHNLRYPLDGWRPYLSFGAILVIAATLTLFKIVVSFEALANFARTDYLQPGIPDIWRAMMHPVRLLFFSTPAWETEIRFLYTNFQWDIYQAELEVGVGWVALLLLILGGVRSRLRLPRSSLGLRVAVIGTLGIICLVPLVLNYHHPVLAAWVKEVPLLSSYSVFTRLYPIYIPLVVLLAALSFNHVSRWRGPVAILAVAAIVATNWVTDKRYYEGQYYNPSLMADYHRSFLQDPARIPAISRVDSLAAAVYDGETIAVRNEAFVLGASNMRCKNDMYGYLLESFPQPHLLRPGQPADALDGERFNMKNPACNVFPEENSCQPGDHFTASQAQALQRFLSYRQYDFRVSKAQRMANITSQVAWVLVLLVLAALMLRNMLTIVRRRSIQG